MRREFLTNPFNNDTLPRVLEGYVGIRVLRDDIEEWNWIRETSLSADAFLNCRERLQAKHEGQLRRGRNGQVCTLRENDVIIEMGVVGDLGADVYRIIYPVSESRSDGLNGLRETVAEGFLRLEYDLEVGGRRTTLRYEWTKSGIGSSEVQIWEFDRKDWMDSWMSWNWKGGQHRGRRYMRRGPDHRWGLDRFVLMSAIGEFGLVMENVSTLVHFNNGRSKYRWGEITGKSARELMRGERDGWAEAQVDGRFMGERELECDFNNGECRFRVPYVGVFPAEIKKSERDISLMKYEVSYGAGACYDIFWINHPLAGWQLLGLFELETQNRR